MPSELYGCGIGLKLYKNIIKTLGYITTSGGSQQVQVTVYRKLLKDPDVIIVCFQDGMIIFNKNIGFIKIYEILLQKQKFNSFEHLKDITYKQNTYIKGFIKHDFNKKNNKDDFNYINKYVASYGNIIVAVSFDLVDFIISFFEKSYKEVEGKDYKKYLKIEQHRYYKLYLIFAMYAKIHKHIV